MNLPTQRYSQDLRRYYRLPSVQVSLTIVLSLFIMATFIVFALRPTIVSIVTLKKTIADSEKTAAQLSTKIAGLQKAATQLETLKPFLPTLNTSVPNEGAMYAPLTTAVESLIEQTGTKLESESHGPTMLFSRILTPFAPARGQSVVALPFTLRVTGDYPGIADFLTKLLSMERIVNVESVTITKETVAKSTNMVVSLSLSGSAYYLADEAQLQKALVENKGKK